MFDTLGFETLTAPQVSLFFALILGAVFGLFAEQTRFCFRRALIGQDRKQAAGLWMIALAVAIAGTQAAVSYELIDFSDHRFLASDAPIAAAAVGGLLFGVGMVLSRGCASRLTVLSGTGNMQALFTVLLFGLVANATLKGPLADLRIALNSYTLDLGDAASIGTVAPIAHWIAIAALLWFAVSSGNRVTHLIAGCDHWCSCLLSRGLEPDTCYMTILTQSPLKALHSHCPTRTQCFGLSHRPLSVPNSQSVC